MGPPRTWIEWYARLDQWLLTTPAALDSILDCSSMQHAARSTQQRDTKQPARRRRAASVLKGGEMEEPRFTNPVVIDNVRPLPHSFPRPRLSGARPTRAPLFAPRFPPLFPGNLSTVADRDIRARRALASLRLVSGVRSDLCVTFRPCKEPAQPQELASERRCAHSPVPCFGERAR
jgi:hypothetical protein